MIRLRVMFLFVCFVLRISVFVVCSIVFYKCINIWYCILYYVSYASSHIFYVDTRLTLITKYLCTTVLLTRILSNIAFMPWFIRSMIYRSLFSVHLLKHILLYLIWSRGENENLRIVPIFRCDGNNVI